MNLYSKQLFIKQIVFLHILVMLFVSRYLPSLNLMVVKQCLNIVAINLYLIISETEYLFMFIGHLDIFSHQLLFCLVLKIGLYIPVLHISFHPLWHSFFFFFCLWRNLVVSKFLILMKLNLSQISFAVCVFSVLFENQILLFLRL